MEVGAVAAMRFVKDGIRAAKLVMEHTEHTLLVGEQASVFAISMGLPGPSNLSSSESIEKWVKWKENLCQPNFWKNVVPTNKCGPYHPRDAASTVGDDYSCESEGNPLGLLTSSSNCISRDNHDTIAMAVIDKVRHTCLGTFLLEKIFTIHILCRQDTLQLEHQQMELLLKSLAGQSFGILSVNVYYLCYPYLSLETSLVAFKFMGFARASVKTP